VQLALGDQKNSEEQNPIPPKNLRRMRGGRYMSRHMRTPDSERRNKEAILHGIARALRNHVMNISEEPLPLALAELAQRLEEKRDSLKWQPVPKLTE
jgi:hypothetical protein